MSNSQINSVQKYNPTNISHDTLSIVHSRSDSPRVKQAIKQSDLFFDNFPLSSHPKLSIFERAFNAWPDLLSLLSLDCSLKSVLMLRLISKKLYELVTGQHYLKEQSLVFFQSSQFSPFINLCKEEKFQFTKRENIEICIISSMDDLLCLSSLLNLTKDHRPTISLEITSIEELKRLKQWLAEEPKAEFLHKIIGLDFRKLLINKESSELIYDLLDHYSNTFIYLNNLRRIDFGDIDNNVTFSLANTLQDIISLSFGNIPASATVNLPRTMTYLSRLSFKDIWSDTCQLPAEIPNLLSLSIGILNSNMFHQSITLNSLKNLSIGTIYGTHNIASNFPNLESLSMGNIGVTRYSEATCTLSAAMPNLKSLTIGNIEHATNPTDIPKSASLKLPDSLLNLTSFTIGDIVSRASFHFPVSMPKLMNLTIGNISHDAIKLSGPLNNLVSITIGNMNVNTIFIFPENLNKLKWLSIGNLVPKVNNLLNLIGFFAHNAPILKLPNILPSLTNFSIGDIGSKAILQLPIATENLQKVTVGRIDDNSTYLKVIKLTESIASI